MIKYIKDEFLSYAKEQAPKEACALAVVVKGRLRLWKCENMAKDNDQFRMQSEDWIKAEDAGEIVGLIHSHPDVSNEPSEADKVVCEATNIPWYIVSLVDDSWNEIKPTGYVQPLVGRVFYHGVVDCYTLCRDWYKQEFNLELPNFHRDDDWWAKGQNLYVENFKAAGFVQIPKNDGELDFSQVQIGDAFLIQIQADVANHAAVYIGDGLIMHHLYGRLSSRDVFGGYYQKHTTHILRHVSCVK